MGNEAVDQLAKFNRALVDHSEEGTVRTIDGILLTKFDTIDDKVGYMYLSHLHPHIYTLTHSPLTNTTYWPHTFSRVSPLPHILTPLTHPFPHTLTSLTHHTSPSDTTLPSHTQLPCTLSPPSPSLTPLTRTPSPHTYTLLRSSKTRSPTSLPDTKHSSLMHTHPLRPLQVGAAISMTYTTGQPIVFVGTGQRFTDLRTLNVSAVVTLLLK